MVLGGVDGLVEVLPGGLFEPVGAAEPVGGDAEVVDEAGDADGAAAVGGLASGETQRHDVAGGDVARWAG